MLHQPALRLWVCVHTLTISKAHKIKVENNLETKAENAIARH